MCCADDSASHFHFIVCHRRSRLEPIHRNANTNSPTTTRLNTKPKLLQNKRCERVRALAIVRDLVASQQRRQNEKFVWKKTTTRRKKSRFTHANETNVERRTTQRSCVENEMNRRGRQEWHTDEWGKIAYGRRTYVSPDVRTINRKPQAIADDAGTSICRFSIENH